MADVAEVPPKKGKKSLLVGLILAVLLGGGGFYAAQKGMIPGLSSGHESAGEDGHGDDAGHEEATVEAPDVLFVEIDPLTITLEQSQRYKYLRFSAQVEVASGDYDAVNLLKPRIVDALNSYLRALSSEDIEAPGALVKLRAQLLRRVNLVVGEERARNLLVMEFVLN